MDHLRDYSEDEAERLREADDTETTPQDWHPSRETLDLLGGDGDGARDAATSADVLNDASASQLLCLDGDDPEARRWNTELDHIEAWRDSPGGRGAYAKEILAQTYAPTDDAGDQRAAHARPAGQVAAPADGSALAGDAGNAPAEGSGTQGGSDGDDTGWRRIEFDNGHAEYRTRDDNLGKQWKVFDADGTLVEQGRDKTERFDDGAVKHHKVDELEPTHLPSGETNPERSHGWEYTLGVGPTRKHSSDPQF
jgi:hypothetical protein